MAKDFANAQDLVNIEEIRDGIVVLKSGEMRQIVMVGGINFSLRSETDQGLILQSYQNFLNGLSFPLQILIHSRKVNIEKYLGTLDERKAQEASPILQDQITEYQEFIRNFIQDNAIMRKTFFVVVPFAPIMIPGAGSFSPFGAKVDPKQAETEKAAKFEEAKNQLAQRTAQVVDGLTLVGLEATPLKDEHLVELFYNFYNPESSEKETVIPK